MNSFNHRYIQSAVYVGLFNSYLLYYVIDIYLSCNVLNIEKKRRKKQSVHVCLTMREGDLERLGGVSEVPHGQAAV